MRNPALVMVLGLALVASLVAVLLHSQRSQTSGEADLGRLTRPEYAEAVQIARAEIAKEHATVSRAVAYVVPGTVRQPNLAGQCASGQVLVVSVVGKFPHIIFGTGFAGPGGPPRGPDRWVTIKADAATGQACLLGVGLGRFEAVAGAANLVPAL